MGFMKVNVLTMYEKLYEGNAEEVVLPGADGELSVWDNHQPCLYVLRPGRLSIIEKRQGLRDKKVIPIKRGIIHVEANRLTAMVEI